MTNKPAEITLTEPTQVGRVYYQLFRETWPNGDVRFFARIGRPWQNKERGTSGIISKMYTGAVSDFVRAAKESESQLEALRRALTAESTSAPATSESNRNGKLELVARGGEG